MWGLNCKLHSSYSCPIQSIMPLSFKPLYSYSSLLLIYLFLHLALANEEAKTYIIHLDHTLKPESFQSHEEWHRSAVSSLSNPVFDDDFHYSYSNVMHGFSARLTPSQLQEIQNSPAHVTTLEETFGELLTTHSTTFLGLNHDSGLWPAASEGKGVIIGVLDTGVWPESRSFSDQGMPPVPRRWKGKCQNDTNMPFSCNNKLIGAQVFTKGIQAERKYEQGYDSPRDFHRHGTHVASTAAGNYVEGASEFGYASGTARGTAPRAHLAVYKVGHENAITASDVLAAMDQAISDGVDVLSLSLAFGVEPYFSDVIAIASLSAVEKEISVVCGAGNDFSFNTTRNGAPWIITVGAGTLDRTTFAAKMTLGDDSAFEGTSNFPLSLYHSNASLYHGFQEFAKSTCQPGSLKREEVAGKVVVCGNGTLSWINQTRELVRVNAYAGVIIEDRQSFDPDSNKLDFPAMILPFSSGAQVLKYAKRVRNPTVKSMRFVLSSFDTKPAPKVAVYSSKGPNAVHPGILKPDIIAPGTHILAAVPPLTSLRRIGKYVLASDYIAISGTSMATPHVSGVVAMLKAYRPEWSPAAIQSAIMTTAYNLDNKGNPITSEFTGIAATPLEYGAGHIDPNRAMDPGLIYDMNFQDYVEFICGLNYNETHMRALLRRTQWHCAKPRMGLNYPSFTTTIQGRSARTQRFRRVVTNVGQAASTYKAVVVSPIGMKIKVEPNTLVFTKKFQTRKFVLNVEIAEISKDVPLPDIVHGQLKWVDEHNHVVSSPVVALTP